MAEKPWPRFRASLPLPIDGQLKEIREDLEAAQALVLSSPPGTGKSTRIPPALLAWGRVLVLEPRRVAARALARRIAEETGARLGEEVGYQVRFEKNWGPRTRILVVTEGTLVSWARRDPFFEDFGVVILDEFHERNLSTDLALALCREAAQARDELKLVVMSATLSEGSLEAYLSEGLPTRTRTLEAKSYPLEVHWRPRQSRQEVLRQSFAESTGTTLVFLPGWRDIQDTAQELSQEGIGPIEVLHGSLPSKEQDLVLEPTDQRRIVLSTNLAESSLTVPGVDRVVDSGLEKVLVRDLERGLSHLETRRIARDSAQQRAGRAARLGPGAVFRLWDPGEAMAETRIAEVHRVELASVLLELLDWGASPDEFPWYEAPRPEALEEARQLLVGLRALEPGTWNRTRRGKELTRLPLSPRWASFVLEAAGEPRAPRLAALFTEVPVSQLEGILPPGVRSRSDALLALERESRLPRALQKRVGLLEERIRRQLGSEASEVESDLGLQRALARSHGDRLAQVQESGQGYRLAVGGGARLDRGSSLRDEPYLVALGLRPERPTPRISLASAVDPSWLEPDEVRKRLWFDPKAGAVRAREEVRLGDLVLESKPCSVTWEEARPTLVEALQEDPTRLLPPQEWRRLSLAGLEIPPEELLDRACYGKTGFALAKLSQLLHPSERKELETFAPATLRLPSGRDQALEYLETGDVLWAAKLQEFFGLEVGPSVGRDPRPITLVFLAPSGRETQRTQDLASFWDRGYPMVRKDLRGRYPKHPWPEDPRTALPTRRTKPKK